MNDTGIPTRPARREERGPTGRIVRASADTGEADAEALARELAEAVEGEVRFSDGERALYATDASNYRQVPIGVVLPKSAEDVVAAVAVCRRHGVPILSRGGGTSLAGQGCNAAVVIDFSRHLDRVLEIDPERRLARVEPGCILDVLRAEAERHGLTFGPDPATHDHCTLGGMIGNNSCGVHSVVGRRTADNVVSLEVLTHDGTRMTVGATDGAALEEIRAAGGRRAEIHRALEAFRDRYGEALRHGYPDIPRRVSGYADLDALLPENGFDLARALVGTEGTCVIVLSATVRLIPSPPERSLCLLGFDDIFTAADVVPEVRGHEPLAIEGIDAFLVDAMRAKHLHEDKLGLLPPGRAWLVVEFGGDTSEEAEARAARLRDAFADRPEATARVLADLAKERRIWKIREAGLPASAFVPERPLTWEGWEDTAVPVERLGDYLRDLAALFERYGYVSPMYGHFGDGLVHCRISFDQSTERGVEEWRRFLQEGAELVASYGGSLSGEHGDGQARAEFLPAMYGPEMLSAFSAFKRIFDPDDRMNPGKVVDPYPATSNLRHGPDAHPREPWTHFAFEAEGGFTGAANRCVGVGKCRRTGSEDGVMCPSYMATREERHSTRGRARLLHEMLDGATIKGGWRADAVEDALKLCLACKGCKSDCPVHVDMATYKAEFRAHYYRRRLRPRTAYTLGLIHRWAPLGAKVPRLANLVSQTPGVRRLAKGLAGIAPARGLPKLARRTFTRAFADRPRTPPARAERVMLWPDTFNDHFRPDTLAAAADVLERAGYHVVLPPRRLCCGRALYDEGMLDTAKALWRRTLDVLDEEIALGTPIVGVEPACAAAFKDELLNLFPKDPSARLLSAQTRYFADFVMEDPGRFGLSPGEGDALAGGGRALVQIHCNHHAVLEDTGERALLERLGIDFEIAPSGCCGMAGAFGFSAKSYDVAMACGERVILPMVRAQADDVAILADGYSCREQIEQATGRPTRHVAEVMAGRLAAGAGR